MVFLLVCVMGDVMNRWIMLALGISILLVIGAVSQDGSRCSDIESLPKVSVDNDRFSSWNIDANNKLSLDVYEITRSYIGEKCITMKVQNDTGYFTFLWMKEGGDYTDLNFYINNILTATYIDDTHLTPGKFDVKKDDELKWIFKVRNTNFVGNAWIAISSQSYLSDENKTKAATNGSNPDYTLGVPINAEPSVGQVMAVDEASYKREIASECNLQDMINDSPDFTELILTNSTCIINRPIIIENKTNLIIKSETDYVKLIGTDNDKMIIINNSKYITISGIRMESQNNGIKISNSSSCIIINDQIGFKLHGYGILITNSSKNIAVIDNLIWPISSIDRNPGSDELSVGLKIEKSKNIYAKNNEIRNINGIISLLAYYVADHSSVNNINIIPYCENPAVDFKIMYGSCLGYWSCENDIHDEMDRSENPCRIMDQNSSVMVWGIQ